MQIHLKSLSKSYGNHMAVDNIDLKMDSGKITAFLGPNGAGKTTTIRMMVGLLRPTSGWILIDGNDFQDDPIRYKKMMSYVPDFPFLYDRLTGREFLKFIGEIYELPLNEVDRQIEEMSRLFQVEDMLDQLTKNYSHGMRQRLVFCSAFLRNPEILIVDEPMIGIDPKTARILKDTFLHLVKEKNKLLFFSTHQLAVAEELADTIAIIHKGKIITQGPLSSLIPDKATYKNLEDYFLSITD
ncbi:MAG: ABC transporter ATP-binding protein [Candidatus Aureabacteria bacterium]|nr:ABC transporter ATP-binding protein [Candidatus Auribacterota bacterium]